MMETTVVVAFFGGNESLHLVAIHLTIIEIHANKSDKAIVFSKTSINLLAF